MLLALVRPARLGVARGGGGRSPPPRPGANEALLAAAAAGARPERRVDAGGSASVFERFRPGIGQGNPAVTEHPADSGACRAKLREAGHLPTSNPNSDRICGAPLHGAALRPGAGEAARTRRACIDQFEFPDIPCAYPVVWVRAREAAELCEALGKRLCDAHEWEGACAGGLQAPDYRFDLARGRAADAAVEPHARRPQPRRTARDKTLELRPRATGTASARPRATRPRAATAASWSRCGSNTFPAGSFPDCRSPLGVYDLNGNAAEHMNLPLDESQMASRGSRTLGVTEMKGSWFIFDRFRAHEDWCRWRAPFWHGSRVMDPASHGNYHLGFRCCKTIR